jgi:hypothetical protein
MLFRQNRFWVAVLLALSLPAVLLSAGTCLHSAHAHQGLCCNCGCPCNSGYLPTSIPFDFSRLLMQAPCDWLPPAEPAFVQSHPLLSLNLTRAPPA